MNELDILRKKLQRETKARNEAEKLLEERALQLYYTNKKLKKLKELNQNLEAEVKRKTSELEQKKKQYQMLVDSAQDIIFVISNEGYFKYINLNGQKIVSCSEEEIKTKHFSELVHPDYVEQITNFYLQQIEKKTPKTYLEFPIICGDGQEIWIGQNVSLHIVEDGVFELTAIARNISDQISKDHELIQLNKQLNTILSNLQEGILLADKHCRIVHVNDQFCNLFNISVSPAEMIGTDCPQSAEQTKRLFVNPDNFLERINTILLQRKVIRGEKLILVDGRIFKRDFIPIYNNQEFIGNLWRYEDITERKKNELRIQQSEEKYRGIIENMELGLLEVDPNSIITKPYPRFCEMTGYLPEELIGKNANEIFLPKEFQETMLKQDESRRKGQLGVYEVQMVMKNKLKRWMMISGAPFYNEEGEMIGSIGIHYDISHQKELQQELELARQEAERARDAEKDFLANMSHEIRNPINSIVGMANLLFDSPLENKQIKYLNNIKYSSDILLALVSDILDITKITEGKMGPNLKTLELEMLVKSIANTTAFRLANKSVQFELEYSQNIPRFLLGDSTFINQILMNLLGNAVKFTHQGSITLKVKTIDTTEEGKTLIQFTVKDTGIGIPRDQLENIFERFSQAGKATAVQYGGTGLGLFITKNLIETLGGQINVKSVVNEGTSFYFQIPFLHAANVQINTPITLQEKEDHQKLKVLIVEDNPVNSLYLEQTLKKFHYQYHSSQNGLQALEQLQKEKYDMILMDIRMPEMDGYETTIRLRSNRSNPNTNIPIIALTASALKDEKEKTLMAGMNYHLTKPFTPTQLQTAIKHFFPSSLPGTLNKNSFTWPASLNAKDLEEMYGDDLEHAQLIFELL